MAIVIKPCRECRLGKPLDGANSGRRGTRRRGGEFDEGCDPGGVAPSLRRQRLMPGLCPG